MVYVNDDGSITSNAAPRYRLVGYDIGTAPDANGGWVHWTDYARLEAEIARLTSEVTHLRADLANAGAVMVEASVHRRTGIYDRDGREICVGDHLRINLESQHTKREYWHPEYEVVWKAPAFTLKHIGGDRGSDTAIWYFSVPQKSSTSKIETIHEAPTLSPIAAAARVLLANTEAENDPEIGPWLRALQNRRRPMGEAGVYTARGIYELNMLIVSLAKQGFCIISAIDTQNGDYHVVV